MSGNGDQLERLADLLAERLAPRVAELLRDEMPHDEALVGPDEIARRLARSVEWVRDHAAELGVIRVGDGPRARMWFRPDLVDERLRARATPDKNPDQPQPRPRKRPGRTPPGELLEVKANPPRRIDR